MTVFRASAGFRTGFLLFKELYNVAVYYINTSEIPGEISHVNMISSLVISNLKITCCFHKS